MLVPLTSGQAPPSQGVVYELHLSCPNAALGGCPIIAADEQDAMGDPSLAVDPDFPNQMIIASLHGGNGGSDTGSSAPSEKARSGQVYTTFTSQNGGSSWTDNPFNPPAGVSGAFGMHPQLTIDPYGHVFIGSLYAMYQGQQGGLKNYEYVIAAQKFRDINDINSNQNGAYNVEYIPSIYPGSEITQMWFEFNPITDNMTMVWHERLSEGVPSSIQQEAAPALDVAALRQEQDRAQQQGNARSTIGVVWTTASIRSGYHVQPIDVAIAPCDTSTNPVIAENWLYIACRMADGEGPASWNPDAQPGEWHMFRMDPNGGTPQYIGPTPLDGGKAKLGVRSDGRVALLSAGVEMDEEREEPALTLRGSFGAYNDATGMVSWGALRDYGNQVLPLSPDLEVVDANVQDLLYREYSGVLHLVLRQNTQPKQELSTDLVTGLLPPSIHKAVVAIDEKYGLLAQIDLDVGNPSNRSRDPDLMAMPEATFNDIADDFLELPAAPHSYKGRSLGYYQREFFAVGDYGTVIFAEVMEITDLRGPAFAPPPPPPPPPIPAPAPAPVPALAPAAAMTAAALTTGSAAAVKRKLATGAGKKKKN